MDIILSNEQSKVNKELESFILDDISNREILLIGYAGTGKTTLITKFLSDMIYNKKCKRIAIAAPTHKAVNIIKNKLYNNLKEIKSINKYVEITTIHRLLNYQNYINSSGERYFARGKSDPLWKIYDIIIIDECSMLSDQIIDDMQDIIKKPQNKNVKIIYVGDPAQLPPVNQHSSKIFKENMKKLYLEKIIRTNCNDIIEISRSQRRWITSGNDDYMPQLENNNNVKLYHNTETESWLDHFIKSYNNKGNRSSDKSVILTWTNGKCNKYNEYIRQHIFNKSKLNKYEVGELLIFNDYYKKWINETCINFYTSEQVILHNVREDVHTFDKIKPVKIHFDKCIGPKGISKNVLSICNECNNIINKTIEKLNKLIEKPIKVYILYIKKNVSNTIDNINELYEKYNKKIFKALEKIMKMNNLNFIHDCNVTDTGYIDDCNVTDTCYIDDCNVTDTGYIDDCNVTDTGYIDDCNVTDTGYIDEHGSNNHFSTIDKYIIEQMKLIDIYKDDIINNQKMLFINNISNIIPIITVNDNNAYDDIIKNGYDCLTSLKDRLYKEIDKFNEENMIKCEMISEIESKINKIWKMWTTSVIDIFAHLNYGYCITVHKSQGSTFLNSYIDVDDILSNNNKDESLKCLYTAITRASNKIILHI